MNETLRFKVVMNGITGMSVTHLDMEKNLISYNKLRDTFEKLLNIPKEAMISANLSGEERVPLQNDTDLKKLLNGYRKTVNCLTVYVSQSMSKSDVKDNKIQQSVTHHSVLCNGCHSIIIGNRFNCLDCLDFDLCNTCFSSNLHNNGHSMIVIRSNIVSAHVHKLVTTCHRELRYDKQQSSPSVISTKIIRRRYSETPNFDDNSYSTSPFKLRSIPNENISS